MPRPAAWLTRNVLVLSVVSLSQDAASELLYPLLPLLLTGVLLAPAAVVGVVEGVAEGVSALVKYLSGRYSDRVGRKPLVGLGYGLAAVGKVVIAAAPGWPVVLTGRVVDRTGKGIRGAPRDALLVEDTDPRAVGRVFGFHRAMDTAGAVVGPLLALAILALNGGDIRAALWWAVIPAVVSALLVLLARERRRPAAPKGDPRPRPASAPLGPVFRRVVVALAVIAVVNVPDALVLLRLSDLGFSSTGVVGAYVLYNVVYAALSLPAGALADRVAPPVVYALGLACFAVGLGGLVLVGSAGPLALLLVAVYGGFNACTDGVGKAWITGLVPAASRGRAQGVFQGLTGGGVFVAGLWAGLAWSAGPGDGVVPLAIAAVVTGLAAVTLAGSRHWLEPAAPAAAEVA